MYCALKKKKKKKCNRLKGRGGLWRGQLWSPPQRAVERSVALGGCWFGGALSQVRASRYRWVQRGTLQMLDVLWAPSPLLVLGGALCPWKLGKGRTPTVQVPQDHRCSSQTFVIPQTLSKKEGKLLKIMKTKQWKMETWVVAKKDLKPPRKASIPCGGF